MEAKHSNVSECIWPKGHVTMVALNIDDGELVTTPEEKLISNGTWNGEQNNNNVTKSETNLSESVINEGKYVSNTTGPRRPSADTTEDKSNGGITGPEVQEEHTSRLNDSITQETAAETNNPDYPHVRQRLATLHNELESSIDYTRRKELRNEMRELRKLLPADEKMKFEMNEFGGGSTKLFQRTPSGGEVLTLQQDIDLDDGQQKVSVSVKKSRTPSDAKLYEKTTKVESVFPDLEQGQFTETNTIVTKTKLTKRGSDYFSRDATSTKHIRTKSGSEYEQTDVYSEREAKSVSADTHTSDMLETRMTTERPSGGDVKTQTFSLPSDRGKSLDIIAEALNVSRGGSMNKTISMVQQETTDQPDTKKDVIQEDVDQSNTRKEQLCILKGMSPIEVEDGSLATFSCVICGGQESKITWYMGSKLLPHSTDFQQTFDGKLAKLEIGEVYPDDEGLYKCVIQNNDQQVESAATLTVTGNRKVEAPCFSQELADETAREGEDVTLQCVVHGCPTPTITWYKNDQVLRNSADFQQTYTDGFAKMVMLEVFPEDNAEYSCVAKNTAGEVKSSCYLAVIESTSESTARSLRNSSTSKPSSAPQPDPADRTAPQITSASTSSQKSLNKLSAATMSQKPSALTMSQEPPSSPVPPASKTTPQEVTQPAMAPAFTLLPQEQGVCLGDTATLCCQVEAYPPATTLWYLRGAKLTSSPESTITVTDHGLTTLVIKQTRREDYGEYRCIARNSVGQVSVGVKLKEAAPAVPKPVFLKHLLNVTIEEGHSGKLVCEVNPGDLPLKDVTVTWVRHGRLIPKAKHFVTGFDGRVATLEISEIYPQDQGVWECWVKNSGGEVKSKCDMTVKATVIENVDPEEVPEVSDELISNLLAGTGIVMGSQKPHTGNGIVKENQKPRIGKSESMKEPQLPKPRLLGKVASLREKFVTKTGPDGTGTKMADINSIHDEDELHKLLHKTEDFDQRRKIRSRLKELRESAAKKYAETKKGGQTESAVDMRKRQAEEEKARKLEAFYQQAGEKPAKPDASEEYIKQKHAQADREKVEKIKTLTEVGTAKAVGYNIRSTDIAPQKQKHDMTVTKTERVGDDVVQTTVTQTVRGGKDGQLTTERKETSSIQSRGGTAYGVKKAMPAGKQNARGAANMFKQMDKQTAPAGAAKPKSPPQNMVEMKKELLDFVRVNTSEYEIEIRNFSGSWNDGMAFCALIHHFYPDAFDYSKLNPKARRHNFTLAFDTAEKEGDIAPLLEVDDMVRMKNPDWKCVFCYIQNLYRGLRNHEKHVMINPEGQ